MSSSTHSKTGFILSAAKVFFSILVLSAVLSLAAGMQAKASADTQCTSINGIEHLFLTNRDEIDNAPVRPGSDLASFECSIPVFCEPVDIFVVLVSPDNTLYYPDPEYRMGTKLFPLAANTMGGFNQTIDNGGMPLASGTWQVYLLCMPSRTEGLSYRLTEYQVDLDTDIDRSSIPYNDSPVILSEDMETLVDDLTDFTLAFYHQAAIHENGRDQNIFFSAYSIENALAMTWAGARNRTAAEMADAMQITLEPLTFHPCLNFLNIDLNSRGDLVPESGDAFQFNLVNAIWARMGYPLLPSFLDTIKENYNAGVRRLDFYNDPGASRQTINIWVEDQTQNRIQNLLPPGSIDPSTVLVLTNAIYFKASWFSAFDPEYTRDDVFTRGDGSTVTAAMMAQQLPARYYKTPDFDAVELPYVSTRSGRYEYPGELSMLLVIPNPNRFGQIEAAMDSSFIDHVISSLRSGEVNLTLPKFEFEFEIPCRQIMQNLGMNDAFSPSAADFTGLVDPSVSRPFIDEIYHKAFINVNEEGTEAAAATAVVMREVSVPDPVIIAVDRPFIFLVRDQITGAILFMGRVLDPVHGQGD